MMFDIDTILSKSINVDKGHHIFVTCRFNSNRVLETNRLIVTL